MDRDLLHFAVGFHGQKFNLLMAKRRWLFWIRKSVVEVGFYTTRFVLAKDANEAIELATDLLEMDIESRFETSPDSEFEVDKIVIRDDEYAGPGSGYTFYKDGNDHETTFREL